MRRPWRLPLDPVLTAAVVGLGVASVLTLRGATSGLIPAQPHYYVNRQATYLIAGVLLLRFFCQVITLASLSSHYFRAATFFFAATAPLRGPLRVRAFVCVRWP